MKPIMKNSEILITHKNVIEWLLDGDASIRKMVQRDLIMENVDANIHETNSISDFDIVKRLFDLVDPETGLWGGGVYSPKYNSTHYTMMDLWFLGADPTHPAYQRAMNILLDRMWPPLGKTRSHHFQDLCVAAMVLNLNAYGKNSSIRLFEIVDYLIKTPMKDGGWNCSWQRKPAPNSSSLHTTLTVLEAIHTYRQNGFCYRLEELSRLVEPAVEFILTKKLFRSVRTQDIIHPDMLLWTFPNGWKYTVIRALDCFQQMNIPYDSRMEEGMRFLIDRADAYGRLKALPPHPGKHHFRFESTREYSRFNTLRLLRIAKRYAPEVFNQWMTRGGC